MNYKQVLCFIVLFFLTVDKSLGGISTSLPILTILVNEISGNEIDIHTIALNEETAHHIELGPKSLLKLANQDLIIINGLNLEQNLVQLKKKSTFANKIIEASEGISPLLNDKKDPDPHAWNDPTLLIKYVENITSALKKIKPEKQSLFSKNSQLLIEKLTHWKNEKLNLIQNIPNLKLMVTSHDGYRYFANSLKITNINLIDDHSGESISPKDLTQKINKIKEFPICVSFGDGSINDNNLKKLTQSTQCQWGGVLMDGSLSMNSPPISIIEYLNFNFNTVYNAFKKYSHK